MKNRTKERWIDGGSKCCGSSSLSKVSSLDWPAALLSPFPHLFLFPLEGTCWENLYELPDLSALLALLKNPPLKEQSVRAGPWIKSLEVAGLTASGESL